MDSTTTPQVFGLIPKKELLERTIIEMFLPEGILEYFIITSAEKTESHYTIDLEENNLLPEEYLGQKLTSKGFFETVRVNDFPIRGRACYLRIKRRRWLNEDIGKVVSRDWELVAKGTRMTEEFASFLKGMH